MRKTICALAIILICLSTFAFAATEKIISQRNEYGGKTIQFTYASPTESDFEKSTYWEDSKGEGMKNVIIFWKPRNDGAFKVITTRDSKGKHKREFFDKNGKLLPIKSSMVY